MLTKENIQNTLQDVLKDLEKAQGKLYSQKYECDSIDEISCECCSAIQVAISEIKQQLQEHNWE